MAPVPSRACHMTVNNSTLAPLVGAQGYWPEQIRDLEASINAVPCDTVIVATPMDLRKGE